MGAGQKDLPERAGQERRGGSNEKRAGSIRVYNSSKKTKKINAQLLPKETPKDTKTRSQTS